MPHFRHNHLSCDILVAGGGLSGVACALAASRQGVKVVLVQDRSVLGGNASSEVRMHVVGANACRPGKDLALEARETGIIEEIRLENAFRNPQRSPSMFDFILYEKCRAESCLTLFLDTTLIGADMKNGRIREAVALRSSTEDIFSIRAKVFVDCTGDGGLGAAAGADCLRGRENRAAFGESLALEEADGKTLGSSLLLMGRKHDRPTPFVAPPWARKFTEADLRLRTHATSEVDTGLEYGFWWMEWGGQFDTIKDNSLIRDELLAIVMGVWDHIKNGGDHGADYWALDWFGAVPGKRESRRFIGQYVLTEDDLLQNAVHPDAIAFGGWPIDRHPPEGVDKTEEPPSTNTHVPYLYDIPLRCCVARDFENLMFAGRNISATHVAFASTRVMATCAVVGEGVGIAAAHAVQSDLSPARLSRNPETIKAIRRKLLRQDAFLIGEEYKDDADLAFKTSVHASSEQANGAALNILSGQTRTIGGDRGLPAEREIPGAHRWMSDPDCGFPAWIQLTWADPVILTEVEIIFDTGLHRHLTLTQSDAYAAQMPWGTGQPECVKDFRLKFKSGGKWKTVASVHGNWQRRWRHSVFPASPCQALRISVEAAWGIDHARIHRVLCF